MMKSSSSSLWRKASRRWRSKVVFMWCTEDQPSKKTKVRREMTFRMKVRRGHVTQVHVIVFYRKKVIFAPRFQISSDSINGKLVNSALI